MLCKNCGGRLESYANNCAFCGAKVESYTTEVKYVKPQGIEGVNNREVTSVGKWFFIPFINLIPLIGPFVFLILLFVWAFGHSKDGDPTFKNWARAKVLMMFITVALLILSIIIIIGLFGSQFSDFLNEVEMPGSI